MPAPPNPFQDLLTRLTSALAESAADAAEDFLISHFGDQIRPQPRIRAASKSASSASSKPSKASGGKKRTKRAADGNKRHGEAPDAGKMGITAYSVLQVTPTADQETIAAAYRSLSRRYHPDLMTKEGDTEKMKVVNAAWELVKDEKKRKEYDAWLRRRS